MLNSDFDIRKEDIKRRMKNADRNWRRNIENVAIVVLLIIYMYYVIRIILWLKTRKRHTKKKK